MIGSGNRGLLTFASSLSDIDTPFGSGRYYDVGVSLIRTTKLSKGRKAWYGITAGRPKWLLDDDQVKPPAGEANAMQVMLVLGFTF